MNASDNAFKQQITKGYQVDPWFQDPANLRLLHSAKGLWWNQNAIVIPDCSDLRATLLHEHHATPYSGHCGVNRTTKLLEKDYWWPTLRNDVLLHVQRCGDC